MGEFVNADWFRSLIEIIESDTEVAALLTTSGLGVYGWELPRSKVGSMPDHAVVVKQVGGPGSQGWARLTKNRVDVWCYGKSLGLCETLRRNVTVVLKQLTRTVKSSGLIHSIEHVGGPIALRDSNEDWPIIIETWLVASADKAVA